MTKVTLITAAGPVVKIYPETKALREIIGENNINIENSKVYVNSIVQEDLDATLEDMGVGDTCRISTVTSLKNAAKVTILGRAAVLTSKVKLEDWQRVEEFMPEALHMFNENNDEIFAVFTGEGPGEMTNFGVSFGSTPNKDGYATVSMGIADEVEDPALAVRKLFGEAILKLNALEEKIPSYLQTVASREEEINQCIESM